MLKLRKSYYKIGQKLNIPILEACILLIDVRKVLKKIQLTKMHPMATGFRSSKLHCYLIFL